MIPRKKLDISWLDLCFGIWRCFGPDNPSTGRDRLERFWAPGGRALACLSVRSGFDLLLRTLAFPAGSEVICSAVTIPDMVRIIEHHGLVPVPLDVSGCSLSIDPSHLARILTPHSRAILIAHLFGSRMDLELVLDFARKHGLFVIEDCAQAYVGNGYRGHSESDVSMFSFGPIKTATALGGGLLRFRDPALCRKAKNIQSRDPHQSTWVYLRKICKYALLKLLCHPILFGAFYHLCRFLGTTHDWVLSRTVRGFTGNDFFQCIRQQPAHALLALLYRKLCNFDASSLKQRAAVGWAARASLCVPCPGASARAHTCWLFSILSQSPEALARHLWARGYDATRGASVLYAVAPPPGRPDLAPREAIDMMDRILYLPVYPGVSAHKIQELVRFVSEFEGVHNELSRKPQPLSPGNPPSPAVSCAV
ncbi:MAG: DegT/DnrJ/EryC1/StrS family aminotransferase [bacterium]|nr:DegT/DnrJ/EryC1/StrS family aminotransferase [bacterium]